MNRLGKKEIYVYIYIYYSKICKYVEMVTYEIHRAIKKTLEHIILKWKFQKY